jgi:hypothetical protein
MIYQIWWQFGGAAVQHEAIEAIQENAVLSRPALGLTTL